MTLLLSRTDLEPLLDPPACLDALRAGFLAAPGPIAPQRVRTGLPGPGTATALIPGLLDGVPAYTVKVNAKFPGSTPALRGVICLHDLHTGELLALLDSATVTAWRTGLAAALGTHALARPEADTVAVVGAGAQAELVLTGLTALRTIRRLTVVDTNHARATSFASRHHTRSAIATEVVPDAPTAARDAEIIITATWSHTPLLDAGDVAPGTHVTSLGADEPGKSELTADLLRQARTVVDDVELSLRMGALGNAGLNADHAAATLSEVLRNPSRHRRHTATEVTVYAPVGLPWQDLTLAWLTYEGARRAGAGHTFNFLA